MDKETIIDYVTKTPANTNKAVLSGMLDSVAGGDPGYEIVTERTNWITDYELTTQDYDGMSMGQIQVSYPGSETIYVTIDGTEYCLPKKEISVSGQTMNYYGATITIDEESGATSVDFSEYPFSILAQEYNGQSAVMVITEKPGTYILTVDVEQTVAKITTGFEKAVKVVTDEIETFDIHICSYNEYDHDSGLPTISNPKSKTVYLVSEYGDVENSYYDEYVYMADSRRWEKIGSSRSGGATNIKDGTATGSVRTSGTWSESSSYKLGQNAFAEGVNTQASGNASHAEGSGTSASGTISHAEGFSTTASGQRSHAEGSGSKATSDESHAEGYSTTASGGASHAEGYSTTASGQNSHAEGKKTKASGLYSHAEGIESESSAESSHAEGQKTKALGLGSHAEGFSTQATQFAQYAHAEGYSSIASGKYSHAEGLSSKATGESSHAEGNGSEASGSNSHAEGNSTSASKGNSHAEGSMTFASGGCSHAEGYNTSAKGSQSHAEGYQTHAFGENSHAEGRSTEATGSESHAEGHNTNASGLSSHAEGQNTNATHKCQHVFGTYNILDPSTEESNMNGTYVEIVGNGTSKDALSNARTLDWSGNESLAGGLTLGMGTADQVTITAAQLKALIALLNA